MATTSPTPRQPTYRGPTPTSVAAVGPAAVGTTRASWAAFLGAFLGWVFDYFEVFFLSIVVVPMAREFGWSPGQVSSLLSVQLACIAIGGILWGYLADRFGRRLTLQLCIAEYAIFTFARAFVNGYELMFVLTVL